MKKDILHLPLVLCIGTVLASATGIQASDLQNDFEFGTDPGRVTPSAAGFEILAPSGVTTDELSHSFRMGIESGGFVSHGFQKEFEGIAGVHNNDFTILMETTIAGFGGSNNRRFGITLFGTSDLRRGGIFAGIIGDNESGNRKLLIRRGQDGETLVEEEFTPGGFRVAQDYTFKLEATYEGDTITLLLTVTSGGTSSTVSTTVNTDLQTGTMFGGGGRLREGWAIDYHRFQIQQK